MAGYEDQRDMLVGRVSPRPYDADQGFIKPSNANGAAPPSPMGIEQRSRILMDASRQVTAHASMIRAALLGQPMGGAKDAMEKRPSEGPIKDNIESAYQCVTDIDVILYFIQEYLGISN